MSYSRLLKLTSPMMHGNDIKEVQTRLNQLGYNCGTADGWFGSKTKSGVIAFQRSKGLAVDGIVGPNTWNKLFGTSSSGSTNKPINGNYNFELKVENPVVNKDYIKISFIKPTPVSGNVKVTVKLKTNANTHIVFQEYYSSGKTLYVKVPCIGNYQIWVSGVRSGELYDFTYCNVMMVGIRNETFTITKEQQKTLARVSTIEEFVNGIPKLALSLISLPISIIDYIANASISYDRKANEDIFRRLATNPVEGTKFNIIISPFKTYVRITVLISVSNDIDAYNQYTIHIPQF